MHMVNGAYTSQMDSQNSGLLTGQRIGDKFHRENGEVMQADHNAARNVLARYSDPEINRYTDYRKVKEILARRTESYRSELTDLGDPTRTLVTRRML